jgi:hypothetical protein
MSVVSVTCDVHASTAAHTLRASEIWASHTGLPASSALGALGCVPHGIRGGCCPMSFKNEGGLSNPLTTSFVKTVNIDKIDWFSVQNSKHKIEQTKMIN